MSRVPCAGLIAVLLALQVSPFSVQAAGATAIPVIMNDSMWLDPRIPGTFHVFGEVRNTGDIWLRDVMITVTAFDHHGDVAKIVTSSARATFVPPQGVVPFDLFAEAALPPDENDAVSYYVVSVDSWLVLSQAVPTSLVILNVGQGRNVLGLFEITGEVQNRGDLPTGETRVIGTFYDTSGDVIYVDLVYVSPREIPPQARSDAFKLTVPNLERSKWITRFSLIAESEGYTSVPEGPWPTLVAAVAVAATVIVMRRERSASTMRLRSTQCRSKTERTKRAHDTDPRS